MSLAFSIPNASLLVEFLWSRKSLQLHIDEICSYCAIKVTEESSLHLFLKAHANLQISLINAQYLISPECQKIYGCRIQMKQGCAAEIRNTSTKFALRSHLRRMRDGALLAIGSICGIFLHCLHFHLHSFRCKN